MDDVAEPFQNAAGRRRARRERGAEPSFCTQSNIAALSA